MWITLRVSTRKSKLRLMRIGVKSTRITILIRPPSTQEVVHAEAANPIILMAVMLIAPIPRTAAIMVVDTIAVGTDLTQVATMVAGMAMAEAATEEEVMVVEETAEVAAAVAGVAGAEISRSVDQDS
jgi:hypothetical protein